MYSIPSIQQNREPPPSRTYMVTYYGANWKDGFLLFDFFFLQSNFLQKFTPPLFLLGTMAKEFIASSSSWCLIPFKMSIFSRGSIALLEMMVGVVLLSLSLHLTDFVSFTLSESSASIWSSKEDLWISTLFLGEVKAVLVEVVTEMVFVSVEVEMTLSNRAASLGEANAFNCFPRLRIVSWHSANFSEAAVISQSWKI